MEKALVEINGGPWDGTVFTIEIDNDTGEPPREFRVSDDGQELTTLSGRVIGSRYGQPTNIPNIHDLNHFDFPKGCTG